jgi:hypothetical protein
MQIVELLGSHCSAGNYNQTLVHRVQLAHAHCVRDINQLTTHGYQIFVSVKIIRSFNFCVLNVCSVSTILKKK